MVTSTKRNNLLRSLPGMSPRKPKEELIRENGNPDSYLQELIAMFPEFPTKMMHCLVLRYHGNYYKIRKTLLSAGWKPANSSHSFPKSHDKHLTVKYFYGPEPSDQHKQSIFLHASQGSFVSFFRIVNGSPRYFLCYKEYEKLRELQLPGPQVPVELEFLSKSIKDTRTRDISWIPTSH
mmetsp:Transcript_15499/g.19733  ORF Transcript_15499/g.19733 Transcript_15499/m.19733 type:complete len:179 (-) Transcript_15499:23-559(-)